MKSPRKSRSNKYYDLQTENNPLNNRQIERLLHDPIRYYDGANENVNLRPIKAVKLG